MVLHTLDPALLPEIRNIILDTYQDAARAQVLHMGVGIEVQGISNIHKSYDRAVTAVRMAMYRKETFIRFEDMGFFKILFSVQDKDILHLPRCCQGSGSSHGCRHRSPGYFQYS